jgi:hypothetical protein
VPSFTSLIVGFFFGFGFGVGCALAVMYSIFMGGYRAAIRDSAAPVPSERLLKERKRLNLQALL